MNKKKKLTPSFIKRILEINASQIRNYSVKRIGLFGSYLKGKPRPGSDIDFLFNKKVDLVTEESLKPALRHIKKEALYAKRI